MALAKIRDIRRQELRRAAVVVMQREGVPGTTLEKVAQEAGASKGIVLHYFRNKKHLFEEAMREANSDLREHVVKKLNAANTPFERVWAVIEANLGEHIYKPPQGHAWLSLCAEVPREPQLARLQKVFHSRMHSNLMSGLLLLLPKQEAQEAALSISALIDGLWVRLGIGDQALNSAIALKLARDFLKGALPNETSLT
ncbi:transcriptional regulator BetI [Phyllobacterium sp. YR531]|uniref:choline-binding transcriptional repressor BetI n=1 Tax=Phyllobacterium sp. YR531 TaxID=1144343 RepID=UPI00026FA0F2|nr:transcriptional regulator BetI [Phyllobacterium sp. YR531]EJN05941.1 transcriptional repressor BetI [Phyllobacterium sp. YR531]